MTDEAGDDPRSAAIGHLEQFGLSSYAARTFVALVSLGTSTAREVSQASAVPRTRVYDAIDELRERDMVDIQQSTPREFWAISAESTGRKFRQEFQSRTTNLATALTALEDGHSREQQRGIWTVEGQTQVTARILEFVEEATSEIVLLTADRLLTDELIECLQAAIDRGVTVKLAGVPPSMQARLETDLPGADLFDSPLVCPDTAAGRLLMVDGTGTLASVATGDGETGIWGAGSENSLVVVLRALLTWQLEGTARGD